MVDAGLWDLNAPLASDCAMREQGGGSEAGLGSSVERQTDAMESRQRGGWHRVDTRVRRHAGAHPRVINEGAARKNRSTCMWIVRQL